LAQACARRAGDGQTQDVHRPPHGLRRAWNMEHYQRLSILGRGSFATVHLAQLDEQEGGAFRVIKEVDLARADDKSRTGALHEAELLKSLSHPNITAYHDAHLADGHLYIVMEYADGGDLSSAVARRRAASTRYHEREAMAIFVQLAMALDYIHERRILHRDLKCKNVFLTRVGMVKLGEFGIAKVLEAADSMAETRIGTPYYLPPEMCTNKPYDFRADIWCLGVVLYEIMALEVPFDATNMAALVMKICSAEPRPVPQVYSNDLRSLLASMMGKLPEQRPSSADIVALPHVRRGIAMLLVQGSKSNCVDVDDDGRNGNGVVAMAVSIDDIGGSSDKSSTLADPLLDPLVELLLGSRCCSPVEGGPRPLVDGADVPCYMNSSLKQALENSAACETLLRELEQEFNLT